MGEGKRIGKAVDGKGGKNIGDVPGRVKFMKQISGRWPLRR